MAACPTVRATPPTRNNTAACTAQAAAAATVYYGGDILTMAGTKPQYVQALAAKDGKIVYVGSKDGALKAAGPGARLRDLKGRTLLPGFIDTHAHVRTPPRRPHMHTYKRMLHAQRMACIACAPTSQARRPAI